MLNRLGRYISAPLAPVEIHELPANVTFQEAGEGTWDLGPARVRATFVNHRGPTLGYRITDGGATVAYLPDHEPGLGQRLERSSAEWVSGYELAKDADLLIHDAQYTDAEYRSHVGWGHSGVSDTLAFAGITGARRLTLFHHDPLHDDAAVEAIGDEARSMGDGRFAELALAREGDTAELPT